MTQAGPVFTVLPPPPALLPFRLLRLHPALTLVPCLLALALGLAVTHTMPRVYESVASVLVPRENRADGLLSGLAAMSGLMVPSPGPSLPSLTPNRDVLTSVLKSRTMAQSLVDHFGLQARYRARYPEDAIQALRNATTVLVSKEGVISVMVEDIEPAVAAHMANYYVDQLDRFVARFGTGEAARQRQFLAEQLARARAQLETAEHALRRFQEGNRAIVLQEQTRGAIEAVARVKAEILADEVQLQVLRNLATDAHPEVILRRRRIEEMKRQLARMQYGEGEGRLLAPDGEGRDFSVPFTRVPELGLELARLTRDLKVQEALVAILTQQFEQARIAEAKDIPVVQILDRAVPAVRHTRPWLALNLALAGGVGLVAGLFLAFARERTRPALRPGRPSPDDGGRGRMPAEIGLAPESAGAPGVREPRPGSSWRGR